MSKRRSQDDLDDKLERARRKLRKLEEKVKKKSDVCDSVIITEANASTQLPAAGPLASAPAPVAETQKAAPPVALCPGDWVLTDDAFGEYDYIADNEDIASAAPHHMSMLSNPYWSQTTDTELTPEHIPMPVVPQIPETTLASTSAGLRPAGSVSASASGIPAPTTSNGDGLDPTVPSTSEELLVLDDELLEILGEDPAATVKHGPEIRPELGSRLHHLVTNGLTRDQRKDLIEKYPLPVNCQIIGAPRVNPELKVPIPPAVASRDKGIEVKQNQIASAISCLGEMMTLMLNAKQRDNQIVQKAMDAMRILCDLQHGNSVTRRKFMVYSLKQEKKEHLLNTKIDTYLFGEELGKTMLSANSIIKTGIDLRVPQRKPGSYPASGSGTRYLNRQAPPARRPPAAQRAPPQDAASRAYGPPQAARSYESAPWLRARPPPPPPPPQPPQPHAHLSRTSRHPPPPPPPPAHRRSRRWY